MMQFGRGGAPAEQIPTMTPDQDPWLHLLSQINWIEYLGEHLHSLGLDLAIQARPEEVPGLEEALQVAARAAAMKQIANGALRRLMAGDQSAMISFVTASYHHPRVLRRMYPYLAQMVAGAAPPYQPAARYLHDAFLRLMAEADEYARDVAAFVGPQAWQAAPIMAAEYQSLFL